MTATKEQEINALNKIREIVEGLGEGSYVGTAFEGCFEIAEENIRYDFADSMKSWVEREMKRADSAEEEVKSLKAENEVLAEKLKYFIARVEEEQEWRPFEENKNVKQTDYQKIADTNGTYQLDDEEAKEIISNIFGFDKNRIKIIRSVNALEINRHNVLRSTKNERTPLYNATAVLNYIRFDCCGISYEMYNNSLNIFSAD